MKTFERFVHWLLGPPRLDPSILSFRRARADMKMLVRSPRWDSGPMRWVIK